MATTKYIGSGKSTSNNGVRVSIKLEDAQPYVRKTERGTWLNFFVSARKSADPYGRTHNAFVLVDEEPTTPVVAEPAVSVRAQEKKTVRRLKRISKAEAAARRAAIASFNESAVAEPLELFAGNEID